MPYVKTHHLIELANEIFTPTGWSSEVVQNAFDFVRSAHLENWSFGLTVFVSSEVRTSQQQVVLWRLVHCARD